MSNAAAMMYDGLGDDYDRFVNWQERLAGEMSFLLAQLRLAGARHVLDAACGTGMHTIALAETGLDAAGADLSSGMIGRAMENARAVGLPLRFETAGFGNLADTFGRGTFEALLCLGNSLPHLLSADALSSCLEDFARCLLPGGLLVIQNRNFDMVMKQRLRWMEPQSANDAGEEWLFLRYYDFEADGNLTFNMIRLHRDAGTAWEQTVHSVPLHPQSAAELTAALEKAGFIDITCYGDLTGAPYVPESSGNLVICARMPEQ